LTTPQNSDPSEVQSDPGIEGAPPVNPAYSTPPAEGIPDAETPENT